MKKSRRRLDFFSGMCLKFSIPGGRQVILLWMWLMFLPLLAAAQQQKVTIHVNKADVQEVFRQIKEQTKLNFVYNAEQLKPLSEVTLNVEDVTVDNALKSLFAGTSFEYKFEMQSIVIRKAEPRFHQKRIKVDGNVTDMQGNPLPGVSVFLKGTTVGTTTRVDGGFTFLIPPDENTILVFSFIGMKRQEVAVKDDKPIKVKMEEEAVTLEEANVISTGYYNVDKRHLTSSVTSIKAEDIMMPGVSTIDQMLESNVPGMMYLQNSGQVGATPKLKIRGNTTILGSQAPLWVLDGVILTDPVNIDPNELNSLDFVNLLGNAISGVNPDDIDRIDVLKDASATAIYGPKASNGVIVITTKKGKSGAPSVSYSVTGSFRRRPHYTDKAVRVMNSMERIDFSREVVDKRLSTGTLSGMIGYEGAAIEYYSGLISLDEFNARVEDMETCNTDWFGILLKNSFSHNHSLSISGGSDHIRYYASLGYNDENGNIRKESSKRYSAMAKINLNYNKFMMSFQLSGNLQKKQYTPSEVKLMNYAYNTSRSIRAYNPDGSLWFYDRHDNANEGGTGNYEQPFSIINERDNSYNKINTDGISLATMLSYKVTPWLKADVQLSYSVSHTGNEIWYGENTHYAAALRKRYNSKQPLAGELHASKTKLPKGGELRKDDTKNETYGVRGQLTFNSYLDKENIHQLTASVIGDLSSSRYSGLKITRRGYYPDRGMIFDIIYPTDVQYPEYNKWVLTEPEARGILKDNLTNQVGLIGTVSYVYKDSYILNANARIDASNKFGDKSNERLLPIWSVSGRWNLHENILKNATKVNTLALKLSFGYQGNMSAQESPRLVIKKGGMDEYFNEYSSTINQYPNPHLRWEKTSTLNADIEFSFFNNKLNGSIGYYYRHTKDAFLNKTVSFINGVGKYTVNKGDLTNQGYELSLNFVPINTMTSVNSSNRGFVWRFDPNFGSVFNQLIDKLKPKDAVLQDEIKYGDYLNGNVQIAGRPLNTFYSYQFKGLNHNDGRPEFYNTEEELKEKYAHMDKEEVFRTVMVHSGCREPFLQGGIRNYFGWRNLGLTLNLAYSVGAKIRMFKMYPNTSLVAPGPETNMRKEFVDRWRRPGDELNTNVPGLLTNAEFKKTHDPWWRGETYEFASNIWAMYDNSDLRVVSGNYLRLQNVALRYVIPESFCKKLLLKSAYVSLSGTNLFTVCSRKLKGQDPTQFGTSDLVNLSVRPMYSFQLNVTF